MKLLTTCFYIVLTAHCFLNPGAPAAGSIPCQRRIWVCPYRGVTRFPGSGEVGAGVLEKQPMPPLPR